MAAASVKIEKCKDYDGLCVTLNGKSYDMYDFFQKAIDKALHSQNFDVISFAEIDSESNFKEYLVFALTQRTILEKFIVRFEETALRIGITFGDTRVPVMLKYDQIFPEISNSR
ncbi:hypothetical protein V6M85_13960 (plasmid) [Sulfolobus tengchongensis]|uniref:Uncharacterized protein n=1 Tax=Sulfolobus tengchongensis TaxID=207809 RepID=A0AAX4L4J2_9CREN